MKKQLEPGELFGNKRIIRFVAKLGTREYYKVECLECHQFFTLERSGIEERVGCRSCNGRKLGAFSPNRNKRIRP